MTIEELADDVERLRAEKDRTRKIADDAKRDYDIAHQRLWDYMDATETGSIKRRGRMFVYNKPKVYGSVADKSVFTEWAEENAPHLIQPAPRDSLITEYVRQCLDNGEPLPPGLNWYTKTTVQQRKA